VLIFTENTLEPVLLDQLGFFAKERVPVGIHFVYGSLALGRLPPRPGTECLFLAPIAAVSGPLVPPLASSLLPRLGTPFTSADDGLRLMTERSSEDKPCATYGIC
jgi:hypothetical protein